MHSLSKIRGRALGVLAALVAATGCATGKPLMSSNFAAKSDRPPVLLVHGIWDSPKQVEPLRQYLLASGALVVEAVTLDPNDASVSLAQSASQIEEFAGRLLASTGAERIDLVGFSMGALISRYWLQRMDGRERTRRFISISGPHRGTSTAYFSGKAGAREMRPGSTFLEDLASDPKPWGPVEVHALWSPFDLMIVPADSSKLPQSKSEQTVPVLLHPWMLTDKRVHEAVAALLNAAPE